MATQTKTAPKTTKTSAKASANGTLKVKGLGKPQVRILQCLSKAKSPMTRKEISEKAPVDLAMLNSYIGSNDEAIRAKNDAAVMPSLRTLNYVKVEQHEEGSPVHTITATGRKTLERLSK